MIKHIPNLITCMNLASGLISIILIMNGNIVIASWLVVLAMVFDFFDGFAARLLNAYSEMGKELDSLADVVSFGVAPGLIVYSLLYEIIITGYSPFFLQYKNLAIALAIIVPVLMAVCAALRLAQFNIDTEQSLSFKGLPTPANALAIISLVLSAHYSDSVTLNNAISSPFALTLISVFLSILMVSRLDLLSLKFKSLSIKGNEARYVLIVVCAASLLLAGIAALPAIIPVYIVISVVNSIAKRISIS